MGRSTTPRYRVEADFFGGTGTRAAWQVRSNCGRADGAPTTANLERWVRALEESTRPGGVNGHLELIVVASARIVDQFTGARVAVYRGPAFAVVE